MNLLPLDDPGRLGLAHRWLTAPANRQWLCFGDSPEPLSLAALKVMTQRRQHVLRAFTDEGGRPVGVVALGDIQRQSQSATIWCVLGDKSVAGRGYGTEAMRQGLALGFFELGLASVNTWVVDANTPSRRMVERVGFRLIGVQRRCHRIGDRLHDRLLFDILPEELVWHPSAPASRMRPLPSA
jgi:RimJ/RimL family protein N-acetyltransferase